MSEESYIKAPCCECNGRVSLPLDAVGVDFNCPHCGAGLQMLLKHVCEHCNGKLSFDGNPDAIGAEIECGHCHAQTHLSPSTFSTEIPEEEPADKGSAPDEPEEIQEVHEEDAADEPKEAKPKRSGPPPPRASRRGAGPPRPRQKKSAKPKSTSGDEPPAKLGRRLAGSGPKESSGDAPPDPKLTPPGKPSKAAPKRTSKVESVDEAGAPSPRRAGTPPPDLFDSEEPAKPTADVINPMGGVAANESPPPVPPSVPPPVPPSAPPPVPPSAAPTAPPSAAPSAPASVERRIAGRKIAGETPRVKSEGPPKPAFKGSNEEGETSDSEETIERKEKYKKIAVIAAGVAFVWVLVYVALPAAVEIFSPVKAKKIRQYTRFQFEGSERHDLSKDFKIDHDATAITGLNDPNGLLYVTGSIQNVSSETYNQVEVNIELYDSQENLIGTTLDYTNQLGPNLAWTFRAACPLTNAASAKVLNVIAR